MREAPEIKAIRGGTRIKVEATYKRLLLILLDLNPVMVKSDYSCFLLLRYDLKEPGQGSADPQDFRYASRKISFGE